MSAEGLGSILLEAAAIIGAIKPEHHPENMRLPIVDELEGFASMVPYLAETQARVRSSTIDEVRILLAGLMAGRDENDPTLRELVGLDGALEFLKGKPVAAATVQVEIPEYRHVGEIVGARITSSGAVPNVLWYGPPRSGTEPCPIVIGTKIYAVLPRE